MFLSFVLFSLFFAPLNYAISISALDASFYASSPSLYSSFVGVRVITFNGTCSSSLSPPSLDIEVANAATLTSQMNALQPGDVYIMAPNDCILYTMGGIDVTNISDVTIVIEGRVVLSERVTDWPTKSKTDTAVKEAFNFNNLRNVRFTSTTSNYVHGERHYINDQDTDNEREDATEAGGIIDGSGSKWWGIPGIGYLIRGENRPRLFVVSSSSSVLISGLSFINSAYWTFWAPSSNELEIRSCKIDARRDQQQKHTIIDLTAFNTDGFDVTGRNVYIHDSTVWNQDDCVCVKDDSQDMLFERISASGLGLTIGSIGGSTVSNITFRDIVMPDTVKGIYLKFRNSGLIQNVLFQNISMQNVSQYPIWLGPAQQSDSSDLCAAHPCSICWPVLPSSTCTMPEGAVYRNITLSDVRVSGSKNSPGVIIGDIKNPIEGLLFENVKVEDAGTKPFGDNYKCENVLSGVATGNTSPVPDCFQKM